MNSNKENKNVGTTTGIAVGFLGGLLLNFVLLIPIAIGLGGLYDYYKNKKKN